MLLPPIAALDLADRDRIDNLAKATPLQQLGRPEVIAEAVASWRHNLVGAGIRAEHRQV